MLKILEAYFLKRWQRNNQCIGRLKALMPPYVQAVFPCTGKVAQAFVNDNYFNK